MGKLVFKCLQSINSYQPLIGQIGQNFFYEFIEINGYDIYKFRLVRIGRQTQVDRF